MLLRMNPYHFFMKKSNGCWNGSRYLGIRSGSTIDYRGVGGGGGGGSSGGGGGGGDSPFIWVIILTTGYIVWRNRKGPARGIYI